MWIIKIIGVESSCHTQECDAIEQKIRFIEIGIQETDIELAEQDTFSPPQE